MSSINHSVLPLEKSDLLILGQMVQDSKFGLTVNKLLFIDWPAPEAQRAAYSKEHVKLDNPLNHYFKVVDNESGLTVGHLCLRRLIPAPVDTKDTSEASEQKPNVPAGMNPGVLFAVMEAVAEIDTEKDVDHLEITHIYIKPSHRGRGIGSGLVQLAFKTAEDLGIPSAVGTEPGSHDFFEKRGFKDKKYAEIDLSKFAPKYSGYGIFRLTSMVMDK